MMDSYISVDLETTGFSCETHEIISIGAWKVHKGVVVEKFSTLVRPVMYIPRNVQELTKITQDMVANCDSIDVVLPEFYDWCEDLPFLGHNLRFDYDFLCTKGKALGIDFSLDYKRTGIDTLKLAKSLLHLESNKLCDVVDYFTIKVQSGMNFHNAEYDSYMTKLVYDRFRFVYGNIISVQNPEPLSDRNTVYGKASDYGTLKFS